MAIQVRRGNESDFDASKMLPGEWAVSLDTRYVRMCFAPGIVLRMSTYDAFEADMAQIQAILAECRNIQSAVQRIQTEVNAKASLTVEYANSANESADRAYSEAERAKTYADNAEAVTGVQIATKERAGLIKGGNNHIAEDGTLMLITTTDSTTQPNSYAGREMVLEIGGVTEQGENPSPTNPQEIKKSVVKEVKTHGKNILNCQGLTEQTFHGVTFTPSYDANGNLLYIEVNGTASGGVSTYYLSTFKFDSNKPCILSGCPSGGSDSKYTIYTENSAVGTDYGSGVSITSDLSANIRIGIANGVTVTNLRFYPMVRFADVIDGTYEPYTESSYTFSQPIELYGKNGVQDIITPKEVDRKWTKKRITSAMNIYHDSSWIYENTVSIADFFLGGVKVAGYTEVANILCTHAVVAPPANIANGSTKNAVGQSGDNNIFFSFENCTTVEEVRAFLDANEVYVYYQLAEETTEALPIADQIGLNSLATYDGITYVEFDSEIEPTFKGKYGTSEVGGYTLESLLVARNNELRLTAVENAVVNNI